MKPGYLVVRAPNRGNGVRYLVVDPTQTDGLGSYTLNPREAFVFGLEQLPDLLDWVRPKGPGFSVMLCTATGAVTLSERAGPGQGRP